MSQSTELDYARELVGSAIVAPDHHKDVITLTCAATYKIDDLHTACRLLALGPAGAGKSTVLTTASYLAANCEPITGVLGMTAPSYVADFRVNPRSTHLIDEIHHLFGLAGQNGKSSKFYTYLNQGYLRPTAFAKYQESKVTVRIPIFGFVFMAGLGLAVPADLRDRSIILKMEKASGKAEVADFSLKETREAFAYGGRMLDSWTQRIGKLDVSEVRGLHPALVHRVMDVWGPLVAIALKAGGTWPDRIMTAFERLELNKGVPVYAPEDQLLVDYLLFNATHDCDEGVPSGQFATFAYDQEHGAYMGMKPGQFKQFAVKVLGPTTPFYDSDTQKMVRGWSGAIAKMNLQNAQARAEELEGDKEEPPADFQWEDF